MTWWASPISVNGNTCERQGLTLPPTTSWLQAADGSSFATCEPW
jgi:hypothetical protein